MSTPGGFAREVPLSRDRPLGRGRSSSRTTRSERCRAASPRSRRSHSATDRRRSRSSCTGLPARQRRRRGRSARLISPERTSVRRDFGYGSCRHQSCKGAEIPASRYREVAAKLESQLAQRSVSPSQTAKTEQHMLSRLPARTYRHVRSATEAASGSDPRTRG
jgi:hypothetical protein